MVRSAMVTWCFCGLKIAQPKLSQSLQVLRQRSVCAAQGSGSERHGTSICSQIPKIRKGLQSAIASWKERLKG